MVVQPAQNARLAHTLLEVALLTAHNALLASILLQRVQFLVIFAILDLPPKQLDHLVHQIVVRNSSITQMILMHIIGLRASR